LAFSRDPDSQIYTPFIDDFNSYSEKNNLDIIIHLNLLTILNTTYSFTSYGSMIENLLRKKSQKYDIFFYDNLYTLKYAPHLLDLNNEIPNELLNKYDKDIIANTCSYDDRLVGLVINYIY